MEYPATPERIVFVGEVPAPETRFFRELPSIILYRAWSIGTGLCRCLCVVDLVELYCFHSAAPTVV